MKAVCVALASAAAALAAQPGWAQNQQQVNARGGIANMAAGGSTAIMRMASTQDVRHIGANKQQVDVRGAVLNAAAAGGHSELNIASRKGGSGSGAQVISIGGPVVNMAGKGSASVVNIGGR